MKNPKIRAALSLLVVISLMSVSSYGAKEITTTGSFNLLKLRHPTEQTDRLLGSLFYALRPVLKTGDEEDDDVTLKRYKERSRPQKAKDLQSKVGDDTKVYGVKDILVKVQYNLSESFPFILGTSVTEKIVGQLFGFHRGTVALPDLPSGGYETYQNQGLKVPSGKKAKQTKCQKIRLDFRRDRSPSSDLVKQYLGEIKARFYVCPYRQEEKYCWVGKETKVACESRQEKFAKSYSDRCWGDEGEGHCIAHGRFNWVYYHVKEKTGTAGDAGLVVSNVLKDTVQEFTRKNMDWMKKNYREKWLKKDQRNAWVP